MNRLVMRNPLIPVVLITVALTTYAEEGFHITTYPGYEGLDRIPDSEFTVHQPDRPDPIRIIPPLPRTDLGIGAPSDAQVLFNGDSLDQFHPTTWTVVAGSLVAGEKGLRTRSSHGDFQLHVEWRTPNPPDISHGGRIGNSGIYIMGRYELQIYDSYTAKIYADGSAAAIYGQTPPLVNACRPPGHWQSYDIVFTAPVFDDDTLLSPARITVFHNGILVQNDTEIKGPTGHKQAKPYQSHPARLPIVFQAHKSPVEFRNIWIRDL